MSQNAVSGDLRVFSIFDVTQSLMMGRKSACVILEKDGARGYLYFDDGNIVAALDQELGTGDHAAMGLFAWRTGTFSIDFTKEAPEHNIETPTDYLMLEVARNLDEVKRDFGDMPEEVAPSEDAVGTQVQGRLDNALSQKLNQAFSRVATEAVPTRPLFSPEVFDPLLAALVEHQGTALFLQVGRPPKVRTATGFETVQEEAIQASEVRAFLKGALTPTAARILDEMGEVSTYHVSALHGTFRLHVTHEWGNHLLTFSVATRNAPTLESLGASPALTDGLCGLDHGLVIVAGPVGSGKAQVVASLIQAAVTSRDRLAVVFASSPQHTFQSERGLCVHRQLPPAGTAFHGALRSALEQGADLIAIQGAMDRDSFHNALAAAEAQRLVFFTIESHSPSHTLSRVLRWAHTDDGDPLLDSLADTLRYVIDVRAGLGAEPRVASAFGMERSLEDAVRSADVETLRRHLLAQGRLQTTSPA